MAQPAKGSAGMARASSDFALGEWLIQPGIGSISRSTVLKHLEPKTMQVLVCLAERSGSTVSKEELVRTVWPETFVSDHVLTHAIWQLRQAFGEETLIDTIPRRGYRLTREVRPTARIRSLAVLPLVNLTGNPEQEYFADGMTEALIGGLARIEGLRVISRTTSMRYKGTSDPLPEIAAALRVDGIVEGSVTRSGERVRISVQLIHGASDRHVWAHSYESEFREIFALQDEIARAIAATIQITLAESTHAKLRRTHTVDPEVHELYLKGRFCHARTSEEGLRMAIAYMQEAIAKDPEYALAYTGLADSIALLASPVAEAIAPADANAIMRPAVERALQLDPELAEAHFLAGWIKVYYEWDWAGAEAAFQRTLALNPNYAMAYDGLGTVYEVLAWRDKAAAAWKMACELDPLSLLSNVLLAWTLVLAGEPREAIGQLRKTLLLDPNYWFGREVLALALLAMECGEEAIGEAETAVRLAPEPFPKGVLGHVYGRTGRSDDARRILGELEALQQQRYVAPNLLAFVLAGVGDMERAFDCLERAFEARDASLVWLKSFEVLWGRGLGDDARYQALLRKMKLA